ncbi:MAG TPA: MMPL family transporter [Opitutaceae bacterium]|nr:MMPL family transporter [Opitutaceae bacterium]
MNFRRRQLLGLGALALAALLGGAWLLQLDYAQKISTDVLDLIPAGEQAPELALVRSMASQAESRTMFLELTGADGRPAPEEAAALFAAALARNPAFDQAISMGDTAARDALGRELFEQRFTLLFPIWLHERSERYAATGEASEGFSAWLARDTAGALGRFLETPEALAFEEMIPADPLLLMAGAVERLQGSLPLVQSDTAGTEPPALVWARLSASPLSEAGQAPAFAAIERAEDSLNAGIEVAYTGVNRFASASRARIEREVKWLNTVSLVAVLAVAFTFIRAVHRGLHLVPIVLLSMLGAWVAVTMAFDRLHIMVFVVGSLLAGVAIDYGFYLFMQPPAFVGEDYWAKVRRLAKPLLASCLTTVAGFALLLFSELPFIRQLGVYVGSGLVCALVAAIVYLSTVKNSFLEARSFHSRPWLPAGLRRNFRRALIGAAILALPGLAFLKWRDDIRELEIPSPELSREDDRIRALFGGQEDRAVFLTYGSSITEARESLDLLESWLDTASDGRAQSVSLGAVVPTTLQHADAVSFAAANPNFPTQLRTALAAAGFDEDGFAPFFEAFAAHAEAARETDLTTALTALPGRLIGPIGLLLHSDPRLSWFVTVVRDAPSEPPPAVSLSNPPAITNTVGTGQLLTLNRVFAKYRQSALWLSLIGLVIVGAGVFLSYGWRDGARIFAIPCGACLCLFGLFGWLGHPLNMFHLLGAFLGVCLTHNYSIFSATSAFRGERPPVSVRMSALTTAAAFGVLATSGIPVVRALGMTVSLMVLVALVVIELEHLSTLGKKR